MDFGGNWGWNKTDWKLYPEYSPMGQGLDRCYFTLDQIFLQKGELQWTRWHNLLKEAVVINWRLASSSEKGNLKRREFQGGE